jgi:hypothetical protein
MTPSSPHTVHRQSIDGGMSARYRAKWPGHGRRPGRRLDGSALTQGCSHWSAVAARTISVRRSAMRRAGPGTSSGRSRKCRRSETNTTHGIASTCSVPYRQPTEPASQAAAGGRSTRFGSEVRWRPHRRREVPMTELMPMPEIERATEGDDPVDEAESAARQRAPITCAPRVIRPAATQFQRQ